MRICDRCQAVATQELVIAIEDERIDLCDSCLEKVREALLPPKKRGRPRLSLAGKNSADAD